MARQTIDYWTFGWAVPVCAASSLWAAAAVAIEDAAGDAGGDARVVQLAAAAVSDTNNARSAANMRLNRDREREWITC